MHPALSCIPGEDSLLNLPRFLSNPSGFLKARQSRFGDVWRTRIMFPVVFAAGPEANQQIHVTERAAFSYEHGYGGVAIGPGACGSDSRCALRRRGIAEIDIRVNLA